MTEDPILRDLLLGFVRVHILHHAGEEPVYGVALMRELQRHGYTISPGTLYPLLHTLERAEYLSRHEQVIEGKIRKYYRLTKRGQMALEAARAKIVELADEVLTSPPETNDADRPCASHPRLPAHMESERRADGSETAD